MSGLQGEVVLYSMSGLEGEIVRSPLSVLEGGVPLPTMSRLEARGRKCLYILCLSKGVSDLR